MKLQRVMAGLALGFVLAGCAGGGWLANLAAGGDKKVHVSARYTGLAQHSVAVLVAADKHILYRHPVADVLIARAVSVRLADNLPGISIMAPTRVKAFMDKNIYWSTLPYDELVERVGVDRLVIIDLIEYRTREPGNAYIWQGVIRGDVSVVEAENAIAGRLAIRETVEVQFPEDSPIGLLDQDDETIALATVSKFSRDAAGLFYDHEIEVED